MTMLPEHKSERALARKEAKRMATLKSIAHEVVLEGDILSVNIEGVVVQGFIEKFNPIIERLGYRPVRITSNMLNPQGKKFAIDIDTPTYCDPGCESYHSM